MGTFLRKALLVASGLVGQSVQAQDLSVTEIILPEDRKDIEKRITVRSSSKTPTYLSLSRQGTVTVDYEKATDGWSIPNKGVLPKATAVITVGAEGIGPWEAIFLTKCEPSSLLPFPDSVSPPPAIVRFFEPVENTQLGEGIYRLNAIDAGRVTIHASIENHLLLGSNRRFWDYFNGTMDTRGKPVSHSIYQTLRTSAGKDFARPESRWPGTPATEQWAHHYSGQLATPLDWSCEMVVRIERIRNRCSMSAKVSGDINGYVFGDVAYFNTFDKGTPITTGSFADPEMHDMLQEWAGSMGDIAQGMAIYMDKEDLERLRRGEDGYSEAQKELHQGQLPVFQTGGDKFGLTLADTKFSAPEPKMEGPAPDAQGTDHLESAREATGAGDLEGALGSLLDWAGENIGDMQGSGQLDTLAQGVGAMTGLFTLEASAPGQVGLSDSGTFISLPLSTLVVAPGGIDEVGRIPFIFSKEHGVGQADLLVTLVGENFIYGTITGELYTEGTYSNLDRRGKITVVANFTALRGVNSCH